MIKHLLLAGVVVVLASCGGGADNPSANNQDPQGFWQGTSASGYDIAAVVLENGTYYSLYEKAGIVYGINYGVLAVSGSSFSGSLSDLFISKSIVTLGTIEGSFEPKKILNGVVSYEDQSAGGFSTTYVNDYDTPASMSIIAGSYSGPYGTGRSNVALNIEQNGTLNATTTLIGSSVPICLITGSVAPRPSGKNVYDLTLIWNNNPASSLQCCSGGACATNTPTTGIAVLRNNSTELYAAWINSSKTSGFLWHGKKDLPQ